MASEELITNFVPAVIVPTDKSPQVAHGGAPVLTPVSIIILLAVTAVVFTSIVPATSVAVPTDA